MGVAAAAAVPAGTWADTWAGAWAGAGLPTGTDGLHAYFVHSYALQVERGEDLVATADYGGPVTAIVARDNLFGTQFHPEKSQAFGLSLIAGFLRWRP